MSDKKIEEMSRMVQFSGSMAIAFFLIALGVTLIYLGEQNRLLTNIGLTLIPAGIITILYELFLRNTFLSQMRNSLKIALKQQFEASDRLFSRGLIDIYDTFPTSKIANEFSDANEIKILQTWIPDIITLMNTIVVAASKGCKVQILLLDPDSNTAKVRGKELGYDNEDFVSSHIKDNLGEISRMCKLNKKSLQNIEVKIYDSTPAICFHSYDDTCLIGMYLRNTPAIQGSQFVIRKDNNKLYNTIIKHYDLLWNNSKVYKIDKNGVEKNTNVKNTDVE